MSKLILKCILYASVVLCHKSFNHFVNAADSQEDAVFDQNGPSPNVSFSISVNEREPIGDFVSEISSDDVDYILPSRLLDDSERVLDNKVEECIGRCYDNGNYSTLADELLSLLITHKPLVEENRFSAAKAIIYILIGEIYKLETAGNPMTGLFRLNRTKNGFHESVEVSNYFPKWLDEISTQPGDGNLSTDASFIKLIFQLHSFIGEKEPGSGRNTKEFFKRARNAVWDLASDEDYRPAQIFLGKKFVNNETAKDSFFGLFKRSRSFSNAMYWYHRTWAQAGGHVDAKARFEYLGQSLKEEYLKNVDTVVATLTSFSAGSTVLLIQKCPKNQCEEVSTALGTIAAILPASWRLLRGYGGTAVDCVLSCSSLKKPEKALFVEHSK